MFKFAEIEVRMGSFITHKLQDWVTSDEINIPSLSLLCFRSIGRTSLLILLIFEVRHRHNFETWISDGSFIFILFVNHYHFASIFFEEIVAKHANLHFHSFAW